MHVRKKLKRKRKYLLIVVLVTKLEGRLGQYFTPRVFGSWIITDVCQRVERGGMGLVGSGGRGQTA